MAGLLDKVKAAVLVEEQQSNSLLRSVDEAVTLTWKQRLIGFGCCMGLGLLLSIIAMPMIFSLNITRFAIFYSIGSLLSISSTVFLMGPVKQCQRMFEQNRILATVVYLSSIIGTLVVGFTLHNAGLCLVLMIIQFAALAWYCLTWIPGGQAMLKGLIFRS